MCESSGTRMGAWQKAQPCCEVRNILTTEFVGHCLFICYGGGACDKTQLP